MSASHTEEGKKKEEEEQVFSYLMSFFEGYEEWKASTRESLAAIPERTIALARCLGAAPPSFVNQVVKHLGFRPICVEEGRSVLPDSARDAFAARSREAISRRFNSFEFPAHLLNGCDLLSDSGTTAMDASQVALLSQGDESYGTNEGWTIFNRTAEAVFGPAYRNPKLSGGLNHSFLFHQGRAAESALFKCLLQYLVQADPEKAAGEWHIGFNCAFDTTGGNIIERSNVFMPHPTTGEPVKMGLRMHEFPAPHVEGGTFLGNCDLEAVRSFLDAHSGRVPFFYLTVTNNKGGGQPASLAHIRELAELCHSRGVPLLLDACRFAENAWFIARDEPSEAGRPIPDIVHDMFACVDGFHASFKKDGLVNMGGGLLIRPGGLFAERYFAKKAGEGVCMAQMLTDHQILSEGHPSYGGLNGRDIIALAQGLRIAITREYLDGRIGQVHDFGDTLTALGVPILRPIGGHAVYIDTDRFFGDADRTRRGEFLGASLVAILLCFGHRLCELGAFAFSGPTAPCARPEDVPHNFVRCAIPRSLYGTDRLLELASLISYLHQSRDRIAGVEPLFDCQKLSLHHFKSSFRFKLEDISN